MVKQHLLVQGYEAYLPRFKKICRYACKVEEKLVPLFRHYIFVGMDLSSAHWHTVSATRGVSPLLRSKDLNPAKVPTCMSAALRPPETGGGQ